MNGPPNNRTRPAGNGTHSEDQAGGRSTLSLSQGAPSTSVEREALRRFADAYAVLVVGKATRRHVFFNLPAAERAVDRAHSRGESHRAGRDLSALRRTGILDGGPCSRKMGSLYASGV